MTSDYSTISFECARHHWLQRIEFTSDDNAKGGKFSLLVTRTVDLICGVIIKCTALANVTCKMPSCLV